MEKSKRFTIPFLPVHATTELAIALVFVGCLFVLGGVMPRGLEEAANKLVTPVGLKPEWYFLWAFALLEMIPNKLMGIIVPGLMVGALIIVPWLEPSPERKLSKRMIAVSVFSVMMVVLVILTYIGKTVTFGA
ncbi:cytochrome b subunit of the bc complex [Heliophilum fasciatum]|uniref:Cytochrome b6-f complex subunit 4 n=1 Tax=Heliophilum fasciatum TaxID=35700 RepID=A0A4R2S7P9_9FIRM|nr:cytochrome b subunit of the bc complex [Heliophilum fasciatum]MCW2277043.1 quinol-cytochrome oxidoreductase complex cytochrome b subunit [Heliophilum fasciatum]TCP68431.1 cytochrome b6-f complex subunit 4 [Heliophilum fasciatum]